MLPLLGVEIAEKRSDLGDPVFADGPIDSECNEIVLPRKYHTKYLPVVKTVTEKFSDKISPKYPSLGGSIF